jgi:3-methyladenine DNA glycosylase/8-oxoguanine DNA glycosylase
VLQVPEEYRLEVSVAPAAWVGERSPRHAWIGNALIWCGREGELAVWRKVQQRCSGALEVSGSADPARDVDWVRAVLQPEMVVTSWTDPVLTDIASRWPGLAPYGDGSLFEGLITSIVGQCISLASAAVTQARLARLFDDGIEIEGRRFAPLPTASMLAGASVESIRSSGVTNRRATALKTIATIMLDGGLPTDDDARNDPDAVAGELLKLPQVGRWTAESALLWGVGAPDAWPTGDVALLRAMKFAYGTPELTLVDIDQMAEPWRPYRGMAARLLWTKLFEEAK